VAEAAASGAARAARALAERLDARTAAFLAACVRCGLCADSCHVFLADGELDSIPGRKVERLARLHRRYRTALGRLAPALVGARAVDDDALAELEDAAFGRCTLCGRCALHCSVGLDPAAVLRYGRAVLGVAGLTPKGIRANADNGLATGNNMAIGKEDVGETIAWLQDDLRSTVGDPAAAMPVDRAGARVLYLVNPREIKFFPLSLAAAGLIFHVAGEDWTLSSTDFDVTNYGFFAADAAASRELAAKVVRRAEALGVEEIVTAECGHGYRALRWEAPEWLGRELPFPVRSMVEVMADYVAAGRLPLDPARNPARVTLHDPCNLVRNGGVIEEQRLVLRRAAADFVEMTPNRVDNYCCGGGGGMLAASEHAAKRLETGRVKAEQIRATGAKVVVTPCHNCIDQLMELDRHYRLGVEIKTLAEVVADAVVLPPSH